MSVGYPKNKDTIDSLFGELAQSTNRNFRRAVELKNEIDAYTDPQLTTIGYSAAEIAQIRAMAADLSQLNGIYTGVATLASAKDFRVSLRPLWGVLGDI